MNKKDSLEKEMKYLKPIINQRGYIISLSILIEKNIDKIIIYNFVPDNLERRKDFHFDFLINMSFGKKKELLKTVLKRKGIDMEDGEGKELCNVLAPIIKVRNDMAHSQWSSMVEDSVQYNDLKKKGNDQIIIDSEELLLFRDNYLRCRDLLGRILVTHFKAELYLGFKKKK